jgi:hypothetical protein
MGLCAGMSPEGDAGVWYIGRVRVRLRRPICPVCKKRVRRGEHAVAGVEYADERGRGHRFVMHEACYERAERLGVA